MKTTKMAYAAILAAFVVVVPSISAQEWLRPSDAFLQRAIDDGFSAKKLGRDAPYHLYSSRIQPAAGSRIEVSPPAVCAFRFGQFAHDKLRPKPDLETVKSECSGRIQVAIIHYSTQLDANWLCVLQKGEQVIQPTLARPDQNPSVETFYADPADTEQVGYFYIDMFSFDLDADLGSGAELIYADDTGMHHSIKYDWSLFTGDLAQK